MKLSEREACFVDAVRKEFAFLEANHGFVEQELAWDGQGITLAYRHPALDIGNYLESDENYSTIVMPLTQGKTPPLFDAQFDEPFTYFEVAEAFSTAQEVLPRRFVDDRALERAVARRAEIVRKNVESWLRGGHETFDRIGARVRETRLEQLVPRWEQFVERIERGFEGEVSEYVAGVNVRGQIGSLMKWPGVPNGVSLRRLAAADREFERLTVPMRYGRGKSRIFPHPRAEHWWRLPEEPKGPLRDYFFRSASGR